MLGAHFKGAGIGLLYPYNLRGREGIIHGSAYHDHGLVDIGQGHSPPLVADSKDDAREELRTALGCKTGVGVGDSSHQCYRAVQEERQEAHHRDRNMTGTSCSSLPRSVEDEHPVPTLLGPRILTTTQNTRDIRNGSI
eukprot:scaffold6982_cov449-Prasinococcus_capsulatus_cf.AAC.1